MIYVSLADYSFPELLAILTEHPLAELRLDRLTLSAEQIRQVFHHSPYLIATCRPGKIADKDRLQMLLTAIESGAAMVDLEYEAPEDYRRILSEAARRTGCKLIISYHNHHRTPSYVKLSQILRRCAALQPDYVKIVTFCRNSADNERLLQLYQITPRPLIAFGMGPAGLESRLKALECGAPLVFAALDEHHRTAVGQPTIAELENWFRRGLPHV
jgi:3-dehydroquinate dehydratase type I